MIADARRVVYGPRSCTNLDGSRKAAFPDRATARKALRVIGTRDGQRPYRCTECGAIHNGHPGRAA